MSSRSHAILQLVVEQRSRARDIVDEVMHPLSLLFVLLTHFLWCVGVSCCLSV